MRYLQKEVPRAWPRNARPEPGSGGSAGTPSPTDRAATLSLVATGEAATARAPVTVAVVGAMANCTITRMLRAKLLPDVVSTRLIL